MLDDILKPRPVTEELNDFGAYLDFCVEIGEITPALANVLYVEALTEVFTNE